MIEQNLFPGMEISDYKEVKKQDHLVGTELTHDSGDKYDFITQFEAKGEPVLYRVLNPAGLLEMVPAKKFSGNHTDVTPAPMDANATFKVVATTPVVEEEIALSPDQQASFDYIMNDDITGSDRSKFYFLTGGAGTGKTTLINYIRKSRHTKLTASTGLAAQHIKGTTIHRFLGIRPDHIDNGIPPKDSFVMQRVGTAEIVVIDEVSMIDTRLFELIFMALSPYKIKIILVGDFCQLPPVRGLYCFLSPNWALVTPINLTTNHRQSADAAFFNALNELRWGVVNDYMMQLLQRQTVTELPEDCVNIMPFRKDVERINNKRLEALNTDIGTFEAKVITSSVDEAKAQRLMKSGRIPMEVKAAVGARVMFLTNHKEGYWVNGSLGTVLEVRDNDVKVELDEGSTIAATYETHEINDSDGRVLVSYSQLPMDLAWAMTVHKSQGTSVDKVGIDLKRHFAAGMTYVALSRARTPEGLCVKGHITKAMADPRVINLYRQYAGQ
jgi:hypothetical protein